MTTTLEDAKNGGQMPTMTEMVETAIQAERAKINADRVTIAEERLRLADAERDARDREKPSWWAEWTKPGPLLAIAALFGGQFIAYQTDKTAMNTTISDVRNTALSRAQEQGAALISMAAEIRANAKAADDRSAKYIPKIESLSASAEAQKLINDQVSDRVNAIVTSIQDLRKSVETLREMEQRNHEDIAIDKARREGRLINPRTGANLPANDSSIHP